MKKNFEDQLQQLAKEILNTKGGSDVKKLQETAKDLYERLTVKMYLEQYMEENLLPEQEKEITIITPQPQEPPTPSTDSKAFEEQVQKEKPVPLERATYSETLAEPLIEKIKDIVAQMPTETHKIDEILEDLLPPKKHTTNELEDFAASYQHTPTFERVKPAPKPEAPKEKKEDIVNTKEQEKTEEKKELPAERVSKRNDIAKPKSINERVSGLKIGLNDRLAFIKHLFNNNAEDYNRVISQVSTFDTFNEARDFIENMVKPDYNWEGKELFAERFMMLIERRFD